MKEKIKSNVFSKIIIAPIALYLIGIVVTLRYHFAGVGMAYFMAILKLICWLPIGIILFLVPIFCLVGFIKDRKNLGIAIFMSLFCLPIGLGLTSLIIYPSARSLFVGVETQTVILIELDRESGKFYHYDLIFIDENGEEQELLIANSLTDEANDILNNGLEQPLATIEIFAGEIIGIE